MAIIARLRGRRAQLRAQGWAWSQVRKDVEVLEQQKKLVEAKGSCRGPDGEVLGRRPLQRHPSEPEREPVVLGTVVSVEHFDVGSEGSVSGYDTDDPERVEAAGGQAGSAQLAACSAAACGRAAAAACGSHRRAAWRPRRPVRAARVQVEHYYIGDDTCSEVFVEHANGDALDCSLADGEEEQERCKTKTAEGVGETVRTEEVDVELANGVTSDFSLADGKEEERCKTKRAGGSCETVRTERAVAEPDPKVFAPVETVLARMDARLHALRRDERAWEAGQLTCGGYAEAG